MSREHPSLLSLKGRNAFITGAAGGLGRCIAELYAEHGANVVISDLMSQSEVLADLSKQLNRNGVQTLVAVADMADAQSIRKAVSESQDRLGGLDILVNCAGRFPQPRPLLEFDEAAWRDVMGVNLDGTFTACRAVLPSMVERRNGCIINVVSDSALRVSEGEAAYGIAKMGGTKLASYIASEYGRFGIRANSIAPGWIRTPMTQRYWSDPQTMASIAETVPVGRMAEPIEIAHVALFLASSMASYVTGHCIVVDGGRISGCPA